MRRLAALGCLIGVLLVTLDAPANDVYRWTDRQGNVHYGDRPPDGTAARDLTRIPVAPVATPLARLTVERDGQRYLAWAQNNLPAPVEVMLHLRRSRNLSSQPALPARATLPAHGRVLVAYLDPADGKAGPEFELGLETVPGRPDATVHNVQYRYPLQSNRVQVEQGYGGSWSHADPANFHAVDFAADEGTPVLAARDGMVMLTEDGYSATGSDRDVDAGRANFVRIVHDDGSMALYAHLRHGGVAVKPGQRVQAGSVIGHSGNTGFSSGPHLHFVVQANRGMRLQSVPFRMFTPHGILKLDAVRHEPAAQPGPAAASGL